MWMFFYSMFFVACNFARYVGRDRYTSVRSVIIEVTFDFYEVRLNIIIKFYVYKIMKLN